MGQYIYNPVTGKKYKVKKRRKHKGPVGSLWSKHAGGKGQ